MMRLANKRVAVIGYGVEGASAARFLEAEGAQVTVCDQAKDLDIPDRYAKQLGPDYLAELDNFDLIVRSPGTKPWLLTTSTLITSPTQLFLERCSSPIIGVTGTKGKGTTSTLITKLLESAGLTVHLGGNIGTPMLDLLLKIKPVDYVVLELSSFQLYDVTISPHIAVVLMIEADHLDWHHDEADYVAGKSRIARFQTVQDVVVYHAANDYARQIADASPGRKIAYLSQAGAHIEDKTIIIEDKVICQTSDVGLIGPHNLENVCAALTVAWQVSQDAEAFKRAIMAFKGLEHRLEFVRELDGIKYYNDSFSVDPLAAKAAVKSFGAPLLLIAGGYDRGLDYTELAQVIATSSVKQVILIGESAADIARALKSAGFNNYQISSAGTMEAIVRQAHEQARSGDIVLFSPACASFDMFVDYKDRGQQFKAAVRALQKGKNG